MPGMRLALAWLVGTALFALGLWLADRWFWSQCSGLANTRYADVWICANAAYLRLAVVAVAGLAAGLVGGRRGLVLGALAGIAGLALLAVAYRPMVPFMPAAVLLAAAALLVAPTMAASVIGARISGGRWRSAL